VITEEENLARGIDNDHPMIADLDLFNREAEARFLDDRGVFLMDDNFLAMFGNRHLMEDLHGELGARRIAPSYPIGVSKYAECEICFLSTDLHLRPCCSFAVCSTCLKTYFETQVQLAIWPLQLASRQV